MCKHPIKELYTPDGLFSGSNTLRCNACQETIESTQLERQLVTRINYLDGYVHGLNEQIKAIAKYIDG